MAEWPGCGDAYREAHREPRAYISSRLYVPALLNKVIVFTLRHLLKFQMRAGCVTIRLENPVQRKANNNGSINDNNFYLAYLESHRRIVRRDDDRVV